MTRLTKLINVRTYSLKYRNKTDVKYLILSLV